MGVVGCDKQTRSTVCLHPLGRVEPAESPIPNPNEIQCLLEDEFGPAHTTNSTERIVWQRDKPEMRKRVNRQNRGGRPRVHQNSVQQSHPIVETDL